MPMIAVVAMPARVRKMPMYSAASRSGCGLRIKLADGGVACLVWVGGVQMLPPVTVGWVSFCRFMVVFWLV